EHNPWAAGAKDRSESARWAALCKRYGREEAANRMPDYAARMHSACDPHCDPHAPSPSPSPPPSPSPSPSAAETRKGKLSLPDWLPDDAWKDWHDYRNARKGWTRKAKELSLNTLEKLHGQGHDPTAVICQSIERGWSGLFPIKPDDKPAPSPAPSPAATRRL